MQNFNYKNWRDSVQLAYHSQFCPLILNTSSWHATTNLIQDIKFDTNANTIIINIRLLCSVKIAAT